MSTGSSANQKKQGDLSERIHQKERLKINAGREGSGSVWSGLGMFGMIGWSVAVPALLGAGLGIWLDKKYHPSFSWTLTLLMVGLFAGCLIAWHWISAEDKKMNNLKDDSDE